MIVKRDSWHYKLLAFTTVMRNYLNDPSFVNWRREDGESFVQIYETGSKDFYDKYKAPTTSCQYFQRVVILPLYCLLINSILVLGVLYLSLTNLWTTGTALLFIAGVLGVLFAIAAAAYGGTVVYEKTAKYLGKKSSDAESFIGQTYKGYKDNICTIIEVKK